jgi:hypothetical protein
MAGPVVPTIRANRRVPRGPTRPALSVGRLKSQPTEVLAEVAAPGAMLVGRSLPQPRVGENVVQTIPVTLNSFAALDCAVEEFRQQPGRCQQPGSDRRDT